MARDFDRQIVVPQVRIAVLNGYTALGIPVTKVVGSVCQGKAETWLPADWRNSVDYIGNLRR